MRDFCVSLCHVVIAAAITIEHSSVASLLREVAWQSIVETTSRDTQQATRAVTNEIAIPSCHHSCISSIVQVGLVLITARELIVFVTCVPQAIFGT
jgi:hypothetical protein